MVQNGADSRGLCDTLAREGKGTPSCCFPTIWEGSERLVARGFVSNEHCYRPKLRAWKGLLSARTAQASDELWLRLHVGGHGAITSRLISSPASLNSQWRSAMPPGK